MTTYYVSVTGDNTGDGSETSPWRTISKAMRSIQSGDEVVVKSGTYNELVRINTGGTADNYTVLRSEVPGGAKIQPVSLDYGVHINTNYVKLDGFEISGANRAGITANLVHHLIISNNVVHDNKGNGISATRSDFITIDGNTTYSNASVGARSGISIYHPENITGDPSTSGYRIIVRNNVSYDNVTKTGSHTDGNGIIMDDFRSTQTPSRDPYLFSSLVENNLVYNNGGKGIQVNFTDHVTVRNNTAWHNNVDPLSSGTWHGELSNTSASNNKWINNIAVAEPSTTGNNTAIDNTSANGYINSNNIWQNNLTFNGTAGDDSVRTTGGNAKLKAEHGNLLGVDPKFVGAPSNFDLESNSPAIDGGTGSYGFPARDLDGNARQGMVDIGAYEGGISSGGGTPNNNDPIYGGPDNDVLQGDSGHDLMYGSGGNDTIFGNDGNDTMRGQAGHDRLYGGSGADVLYGDGGNNRVYGERGADTLFGSNGGDILDGGYGRDLLKGMAGKDTLTGGPATDVFEFDAPSHAGRGVKADEIRDFSRGQGDKIDLSGIDADTHTAGNQAFTYVGAQPLSGTAGELRYQTGIVSGDVNGDGVADLELRIVNNAVLGADAFIL